MSSLEKGSGEYQYIGPLGYSQVRAGPIYRSSGFKGLKQNLLFNKQSDEM